MTRWAWLAALGVLCMLGEACTCLPPQGPPNDDTSKPAGDTGTETGEPKV